MRLVLLVSASLLVFVAGSASAALPSLKVNGATAAKSGQSVISITVQNPGGATLAASDWLVSLKVDGNAIDVTTVLLNGGNQVDGTITITKPVIAAGNHKVEITVKLSNGGNASTAAGGVTVNFVQGQ